MKLARLRHFANLLTFPWRKVRWSLLTGSMLMVGCAKEKPWLTAQQSSEPLVPARIARGESQHLPPPAVMAPTASHPEPAPVVHPAPPPVTQPMKPLPVTLDAVLRMTEGQNKQVALARERLYESQIKQEIADLAWIPVINAGLGYFRHEGGIQNEPGPLIRSSTGAFQAGFDLNAKLNIRDKIYRTVQAESAVWQQQGELARVTTETLVEATSSYIDLLFAKNAEAVLLKIQEMEKFPVEWVEEKFKNKVVDVTRIMVDSTRAQVEARKQAILQARQSSDAAAAQLTYLLGLPPHSKLFPAEARLAPVDLLPIDRPTETYVKQVMARGPGIHELENLMGVIQNGISESTSWKAYMPIVEVRMLEGAFGAGQGSTLDFDNRWDLGVQARWNLTDLFTTDHKIRQAHSQLHQAQLAYDDLRGKLGAGAREAHQAILHTRKQLEVLIRQIKLAQSTYEEAKKRLEKEDARTPLEMMQALQTLQYAQLKALSLIQTHNKAQVRLLVLLGPKPQPEKALPHAAHPAPVLLPPQK